MSQTHKEWDIITTICWPVFLLGTWLLEIILEHEESAWCGRKMPGCPSLFCVLNLWGRTRIIISLLSPPLFCFTSAQYCLPVPPGEIWKWLRTDFQSNKLTSFVLRLEQKTRQALLRLFVAIPTQGTKVRKTRKEIPIRDLHGSFPYS